MLTKITTEQPSITPEDHAALTSSTPASFASIPPVLRFRRAEVRVAFFPDWEAYGETTRGTLLVTESALSFVPSSSSSSTSGFSLDYPSITLHAISKDGSGGEPSLYCQLDESPSTEGAPVPAVETEVEAENDGHYHPEREEEQDSPMREMRLFAGEASLEPLFLALSQCASLHPSIFDDVDGMSDDEGIYADPAGFEPFTGAEGEELSEVGRVRSEFAHPEARFRPY